MISYCLDIQVGHNDSDREALIDALHIHRVQKEITVPLRVACGIRPDGMRVLRIYTSEADHLHRYIRDHFQEDIHGDPDDFTYIVHEDACTAEGDPQYLHDTHHERGSNPFEI